MTLNRHQFEQAAKHFRAGRLTLSDFADQLFPRATEDSPGPTDSYEECSAKMKEYEQLFQTAPEAALIKMVDFYMVASSTTNHEVSDAIELWIQGEMTPGVRDYISKKVKELEVVPKKYRAWLELH